MKPAASELPQFFRVVNFEKFQHYGKRNPPWIKLYRSIFDDFRFTQLPDSARAHLMSIWLLASQTHNELPFDPAWIKSRIFATSPVDLERLLGSGFIELANDADNTLASDASIRREEERRDREEEEERDALAQESAPEAHKKRTPTPPPLGAAPKSPSPPTPTPSKDTQKPPDGPQGPSGPPPVLTFPARGKVKERPVTVAELDNLIHDFDTLDVLWELRKAERWAKAHPEKRWTVKGFDAGLNSWLTRALTPLAGKKYEMAPGIKDERFARYRALFPDWDVEKVVWAMLSGEEWQERKKRRMEEAEARQEAEADAARRRDPASPEGMGSAIDGILAKAKGGDA